MDEFAVAHVDTDMAEGTAHGVEEHQIAGLQLFLVNDLCAGGLLVGLAGQDHAHGFFVHSAHEAAAIKPGGGTGAAPAVGHADETHGVADQIRGTVCDHMGFVCDGMAHFIELGNQPSFGQKTLDVLGGCR